MESQLRLTTQGVSHRAAIQRVALWWHLQLRRMRSRAKPQAAAYVVGIPAVQVFVSTAAAEDIDALPEGCGGKPAARARKLRHWHPQLRGEVESEPEMK